MGEGAELLERAFGLEPELVERIIERAGGNPFLTEELTAAGGRGDAMPDHLRELLLTKIFQIDGVQRTETFLSLADVEPENFTAAMLDQMSARRAAAGEQQGRG